MSFWKRTLLGKDESSNGLPNSAASKTDKPEAPPLVAKTESPKAVGPPPTATAYTHSPIPKQEEKKEIIKENAPPPPSFHIFTPTLHEDEIKNDASIDDGFGVIVDETAAVGDAEHSQNVENQDQADEEEIVHEPEATGISESEAGKSPTHSDTPSPTDDPIHLDDDDVEKDNTEGDRQMDQQMDQPAPDSGNNLEMTQQESSALALLEDTTHPLTPLFTDQQEDTALVLSQRQEGTPLSPKFDFLNNDSLSLVQLQESTFKRRHESHARIFQLDCQLASLQAKLAHESMNRAIEMPTLDTVATKPLEAVVERLGNKLLVPSINGHIHSRLCKLEAAQMKHTHVTLPDSISTNLDTPHDFVRQELQATLRLETHKADKRIGTLVRRFESSIAGTVARRCQEETASRKAALLQVESLAQDAADLDEQRALDFLESLRQLKESLQRERQERQARDKQVMDMIVERTTELKRALLEAAGSSS